MRILCWEIKYVGWDWMRGDIFDGVPVPASTRAQAEEALRAGRYIRAIRCVWRGSDMTLRQSKEYVDALRIEMVLPRRRKPAVVRFLSRLIGR